MLNNTAATVKVNESFELLKNTAATAEGEAKKSFEDITTGQGSLCQSRTTSITAYCDTNHVCVWASCHSRL